MKDLPGGDAPVFGEEPGDDLAERWADFGDAIDQIRRAAFHPRSRDRQSLRGRTVPTFTDEERARKLDSIHAPSDAGEWREGLIALMRRIPDGWGRWVSCERGWYPILVQLDQAMAEMDPDYVLHQAKQKFGHLRYYFEPAQGHLRPAMNDLVRAAEAEAAQTCERCGHQPARLHSDRPFWQTLCGRCAAKPARTR